MSRFRGPFPGLAGVVKAAAMPRVFLDDLIAANSARLRAMGAVKPDAANAIVTFGGAENAFRREIRIWHRKWTHGRGLSLFLCPECGGKAQILRVFDGKPQCRRCLERAGIRYRIASGSPAERAKARRARIAKLKAKLAGGPLRFRPRPGRGIERRAALEASLRRAMVVAQEDLIKDDPSA